MSAFDPSCIDVEDFLSCLEIRNARQATEKEMLFSCPFPGHSTGDESPSAYMNIETTAFFCHSCHEKGNAIHFTRKVLGCSPLEAIRLLKQRYSPAGINPEAYNMVAEVEKILTREPDATAVMPTLDPIILDRFAVDWHRADQAPPELLPPALHYIMRQRDFDPETLIDWDFGYDEKSDRVVFPVFDHQGTLVGFKGRTWDPERQPKYLVLGDRPGRPERYGWPCYHTSRIVFGLHRFAHVRGEPDIIICEGELNAVALSQMGFDFAVAVNGSNFSDTQAKLIRQFGGSATVFFDSLKRDREGNLVPDEAGRDGTEKVVQALKPFMPVRVVPEHEGDPASMDQDEVVECLENAISCTVRSMLLES